MTSATRPPTTQPATTAVWDWPEELAGESATANEVRTAARGRRARPTGEGIRLGRASRRARGGKTGAGGRARAAAAAAE
jgi:hypothetical protein